MHNIYIANYICNMSSDNGCTKAFVHKYTGLVLLKKTAVVVEIVCIVYYMSHFWFFVIYMCVCVIMRVNLTYEDLIIIIIIMVILKCYFSG